MKQLSSRVCRTADSYSEWYARRSYRKMWEWAAIVQVLHQADMIREGRSALGFAVGTEPLPSYFAAHKVRVLATDLDTSATDSNWSNTGQQSTSVDQIWNERFLDKQTFKSLVTFQQADMTRLFDLPPMQVDFLWSSCSLEHLGSLEAGLSFIERAMDFVKSGGLAVHMTEYNVLSNEDTLETGWAVIYRRKDLEELKERLETHGRDQTSSTERDARTAMSQATDLCRFETKTNQRVQTGSLLQLSQTRIFRSERSVSEQVDDLVQVGHIYRVISRAHDRLHFYNNRVRLFWHIADVHTS